MAKLTKLFTPIKIGQMEVKNRIVMSPMTTLFATMREEITPLMLAYYSARAKGGVGMITVEVCTVDRPHNYQFKSLALWDDKFIAKHRELTAAIHAHGAKVVPQISHPGPESRAPVLYKIPAVGPSVIKSVMTEETCKELTKEEIAEIVAKYGDAARRAREAGYDGMELHAAHSYMLVGSFLSPLRNKRTDEYGGSLENRARFAIEVIKSMKAKAGADFPLIMRISGDEMVPGGRTLEETVRMAPMLVEAGVDAFHVSGGVIDKLCTVIQAGPEYPLGLNVPAAAALKKAVKVPIMVVGRIKYPLQAEAILQKGQADLVVMARALLADPELPNKARAGKLDEIRHCISCLNCFDSQAALEGLNCAVNGQLGFETEYTLEPAPKPKKVMIIGGGPAGMEAARVAAIRGHKVTLYEKQSRLGGSLIFASTVHPDNEDYLRYLKGQMAKLPITVKLNQEANAATVVSEKPDVVIVALGPDLVAPKIPGDQQRHVMSGPDLKQILGGNLKGPGAKKLPAWQRWGLAIGRPFITSLTPEQVRKLTHIWMPIGKHVAVIGADLAGCELAQFLAERGRKVTLLDSGEQITPEVGIKRRDNVQTLLKKAGVTVLTKVTCKEITKKGVIISTAEGKEQLIEAKTVILAGEARPNPGLFEGLQGKAPEVYAIGDCAKIGLIRKATATAMAVAAKI